jgi:Tfp pilus assembly protein PilO
MDMAERGDWHLDKRVPVALIFGLLIQMIGFGWWASQLESRLTTTERDIGRLERQAEAAAIAVQQQAVQLGRIEESVSGMRADIQRLVRVLERSGP